MTENDEELEHLRRKRLQELEMQQKLTANQAELQEQRLKELEEQKKALFRQILTPDARERLARVRLAMPEFVDNVEQQIILLAQSGQLHGQINDKILTQILQKLAPKKKEIKITRISK